MVDMYGWESNPNIDLGVVPLNIKMEILKIKVADSGYKSHLRKSPTHTADGGWHNVVAYLINRLEQKTNYEYRVFTDFDDLDKPLEVLTADEYRKRKKEKGWC